ncbi:MAG: glucose-6-phosphate isomerase, partial [Gemmobacter sp.]|nr:glucose-6-phosphate isomerase [Gemmobacter sp.]
MTTEHLWAALAAHHTAHKERTILSLFGAPGRAEAFSASLPYDDGESSRFLFDFSKTLLDQTALSLLLDLAREAGVPRRRDAMFRGDAINETEGRAVLHTVLRGGAPDAAADARADAEATLARMRDFAQTVRAGSFAGQGGPFTDVVNI